MKVTFICRAANYVVWINNKRVQFVNGEYTTEDGEVIAGIRKLEDFGKIIFVNDGPIKSIDDVEKLVPDQKENKRKFYCKVHNLYFNNRSELCKHLRTVHMIQLSQFSNVNKEGNVNDSQSDTTGSEDVATGANR
jgi:hypothetical protein